MTDQYLPDTFGAMTGAYNAGRLLTQQNKAIADKAQLRTLAPQVLNGDPNATAQAYAIDPDTAKAYGEGADRIGLQLHNIANQIVSMQKAGNEQGAAMLYSQAAPMIRQKFPNAPAQYDPVALKPALDAVVGMTSGLGAQKGMPNSYEEFQLAQQNPEYGKFIAGQQPTQLTSIPVPGGSMTVQWNPRTKQMTDLQGNPVDAQGNAVGGQAPAQPQGASAYAPAPQVTDGIDMTVNAGANVPQGDEVAMLAAAQNPGTQYVPQANGGAAPMGAQPAPQAPSMAGRLGFKPDKVDPGTIGKRMQELQDLRAAGQQFTEADASAYLKNGKFPDSEGVGGTAADPLGGLSASDAALVRKLSTYDALPASLGRAQNRADLLGRAALLNPDFSEANSAAAYALKKDMGRSTPGSIGGSVTSLNTIGHHLGKMMQDNAKLKTNDFTPINTLTNLVTTKGGSPEVTNFNQDKTFIAEEMAKLVKGGVASESEMHDIMAPFDAAGSQEQRNHAISGAAQFVYGRMQAIEHHQAEVLGAMGSGRPLMSPEARKIMAAAFKLGGHIVPAELDASNGAAPQQSASPRAPAIGTVEDGHRFKGGNPADPASWEAVR